MASLAACSQVLGLQQPVVAADADVDAPADAPPCIMPFVHDSFDTTPACASWGQPFTGSGGTVAVANGQLVIQPAAQTTDSIGGCMSAGSVRFADGIFVQVTTPPSGTEFMELLVTWPDSSEQAIGWGPTTIEFRHSPQTTSVPFDPRSTTWVRLRPLDATTSVAETSGDGVTWTVFATDPSPPPAAVSLALEGGTFTQDPNPPPILFDGLNVCPM